MSSEEDVVQALKALAEADAGREAPPEVEARLKFAFRSGRRRARWPLAIAAAAAILAIMAALYSRPRRIEPERAVVEAPAIVQPAPRVEPEPQPVRRVVNAGRRQTREVATQFFPLMDAPPPLDRAELVRVSLPASAMRAVGLPVREDRLMDRVQADVVVSEEGFATAIRFVKNQ